MDGSGSEQDAPDARNLTHLAQLRKLLESAKTSEAEMREELAALREENLQNMLTSEGDDGNSRSHEVR